MSILQSLQNTLGSLLSGSSKSSNESSDIKPTGYEAYGTGYSNDSAPKSKELFSEMRGWVASCVSAIADEVGTINVRLYKETRDGIEEVVEHPILDLLYKVNGFSTRFDHFWLTQAYLEMGGEAPWFLDMKNGKIEGIYLLSPSLLKIVSGDNFEIAGYKYMISPSKEVTLHKNEIVFLKNPNPSKPLRGIGTLEMAARVVDIDNYAEEWNKQFYQNAARPDAVLTVNTERLNEDQKEQLKKSLRESYQGVKNAHKVMVLFGDMQFEKSGFNMKDMDFLEQQRFSRDKILGIFRVPKAIVAQTEGVNYASAKAAQYVFARWTIKPKMERLVQQLNEFLLPMFPGTENMFLDYDNPIPDDDEAKLKRYENALKFNWMTINEVRYEENLPPIEGGDEIRQIPSTPSGGDGTGKGLFVKKGAKYKRHNPERLKEMYVRGKRYFEIEKDKNELKETIKDRIRKELIEEEKKKKRAKIKTKGVSKENPMRVLSKKEKEAFWEVKNTVWEKYKGKVEEQMIKIFTKQRRSILAKLSKKKSVLVKSSNELYDTIQLDLDKQFDLTLDFTLPTLEELFKEAGDKTFEMLELDTEMDMEREEVQKLLKMNVRKFSDTVTDTTNELMKKEVIEGLAKGETIPEITERIKNVFTDATEHRAEMISRTETIRYNTRASQQAYVDSGIVEAKQWMVNPDACDVCLELDGKIVGLDDDFVKKGNEILGTVIDYEDIPAPPLHPNCKCDIVPIFKTKR